MLRFAARSHEPTSRNLGELIVGKIFVESNLKQLCIQSNYLGNNVIIKQNHLWKWPSNLFLILILCKGDRSISFGCRISNISLKNP